MALGLMPVPGLAADADEGETAASSILVIGVPPPDSETQVGQKDSTATVYETGARGIDLKGSPGGANIYHALSLLPGVNAGSADAIGLANIPGGNKGLRVRGDLMSHGAAGTIDGIPISSLNPGPGMMFLVDSGNLAGLSLAQGPIAPNMPAFITAAGVADMQIDWPHDEPGLQTTLAAGSHNFMRGFVRADSGTMGNASLFLSGSWASADKWRGLGRSPDGNLNLTGGFKVASGGLTAKLLATYVDSAQYNYRALTYDQARDLGTCRDFDFLTTVPAAQSDRWQYYRYNRQSFKNTLVLGDISYDFGDSARITFKPYYMKEKGEYFDGMSTGIVRNWLINHDFYGFVAEGAARVSIFELRAGIWHGLFDPPGPPTTIKLYTPDGKGGFSAARWMMLVKPTEHHRIDSLYGMVTAQTGGLTLDLGARYIRQVAAGLTFYNTAGIGDVSVAEAFDASTGIVASRSADRKVMHAFLPYGGLRYEFSPRLAWHLAAGRNYGSAGFDVWPTYQQNFAAFNAAGLTANVLWQNLRPEITTAVDMGLKWTFPGGFFSPTVYFADSKDRSVAYDNGIGLSYAQNVAKSRAYGVQAALQWAPAEAVELFGSASWGINKFREDLPVLSGTSSTSATQVKGLQFPDAPKFMATAGMTLSLGNAHFTPVLSAMSKRYADTAHEQPIAGRVTLDLNAGYTIRTLKPGTVDLSISVINVFDKKYIDMINASYFAQTSTSTAAFYPGAPRTVIGKVGFRF
ncbi:TonB-dependent receptor [Novosphingobium naphthalenivorans]|uniref:TonB-dependent receptor n=1 Tax=Novosphingobium naphthalenivorans TaxID=273168 RepID=UPI00082CEEC0|nr:TonB-dependent receptor [Novosphingobium naphthalenivorans]